MVKAGLRLRDITTQTVLLGFDWRTRPEWYETASGRDAGWDWLEQDRQKPDCSETKRTPAPEPEGGGGNHGDSRSSRGAGAGGGGTRGW